MTRVPEYRDEAMLEIKRAGILLDRDILFIATGDEEVGGRIGAQWFTEHEKDIYADAGYLNMNSAGSGTARMARNSTA